VLCGVFAGGSAQRLPWSPLDSGRDGECFDRRGFFICVTPVALHFSESVRQPRSPRPHATAPATHVGLLRGIALVGAHAPNTSRSALVDDSLVTGLEVADLDLSNCRLVVLSACEARLGVFQFAQ
jgi:hypothetical protein